MESSAFSATLLAASSLWSDTPRAGAHCAAKIVSMPGVPLPSGRRVPFGWQAATIAADSQPLLLAWPHLPPDMAPTHLRLTVALDMRDETTREVEAVLAQSQRVLGIFDIRYPNPFQIFQIPLSVTDAPHIRREGIALRMKKGRAVQIFVGGEGIDPAFTPHLLLPIADSPFDAFTARLNSLASVQTFGWMEGCVLDGLLDMSELAAYTAMRDGVRLHLDRFIQKGKLVYEFISTPNDGKIYGIEATLPFAALAHLEPKHALLDTVVKFWQERRDGESAIIDGRHTSSEGAYTVGYPLAVIARQRNNEALMQLALTQLRVRQARLFDGQTFWRTSTMDDQNAAVKGNRLWARGIAWQLLGMARTLRELKGVEGSAELIGSFTQLANWSMSYQNTDGLWSVFVDEPQLAPDTSGSAGIAAALAIGARQGWLGVNASQSATRTLEGLQKHLTPDGFLGGAAQANKGGEGLQRSDYRVIYQVAMGLMAQLVAALHTLTGQ